MKNSQKGFSNAAMTIIVVAVVVAANWWWLKQNLQITYSPSPTPSSRLSTANPTITPAVGPNSTKASTPTLNPTAGWKTYTNASFGVKYIVKYPTDFTAKVQDNNALVLTDVFSELRIETPNIVSLGVYQPTYTHRIVDGKKVTQMSGEGTAIHTGIVLYFDDQDLKNIQIIFQFPPEESARYLTLFDQIISTFKFIK